MIRAVSGMIIFILVVAVLVGCAVTTSVVLWKTHRSRAGRVTVATATIAGNLFWLAVPLIIADRTTMVASVLRSVTAPPFFTWYSASILFTALLLLLLAIKVTFLRRHSFFDFVRIPSLLFWTAGTLVFTIGVFQALIPLEIKRVEIEIESLDPRLRGTKIALLSDIHAGLFTRRSRLHRIGSELAALEPHLVLAAGDLIDDEPRFTEKLLSTFEPVPVPIPVLAVLGNHEMYGDPHEFIRRMAGSRVRLLVNEGFPFERDGATLWIAGLSDYAADRDGELAPNIAAAVSKRPAGATTILFAHQPRAFRVAPEAGAELTLAGHTHGGQLAVPGTDITLAGAFLPCDTGICTDSEGRRLYVTTGAGYWVVPSRFGVPPEIVLITLR